MIEPIMVTGIATSSDTTSDNSFIGDCKVVVQIVGITKNMIDFCNGGLRRRIIGRGCNRRLGRNMINPFLSEKMVGDCLKIFIAALGESLKNNSIGFIRQGANFI